MFLAGAMASGEVFWASPHPALAQGGDTAPLNLSALIVDDGIALNWDAPAAYADAVTGYEILRRVPRKGETELTTLVADTGSAATSYTDTAAIEPGQRYVYRVKALRGSEQSDWSNFVRVDLPEELAPTPAPAPTPTPEANEPPVVEAGDDLTVEEGIAVVLGGSGLSVSDAEDDALTYVWAQTSPDPSEEGSPRLSITHPDPALPEAAIVAPELLEETDFVLKLTVSDGVAREADAPSDYLTVTVEADNDPPLAAIAAPAGEVESGSPVTLDASHSLDPEGQPLSFTWAQDSGPAVTLDTSDPGRATFNAPEVTEPSVLHFTLTLSDGDNSVDTTAEVNVRPAPVAQQQQDNTPPSVVEVSFDGTGPYKATDVIRANVRFSKPVTVESGTPALTVTIGDRTSAMTYVRQENPPTYSLDFTYRVRAGDNDDDGASIAANAFSLSGAVIEDVLGQAPSSVAHSLVAGGDTQRVDTLGPSVVSVQFSSTSTGPYGLENQSGNPTISGSVTLSEEVRLDDDETEATIDLQIGNARKSVRLRNLSGSVFTNSLVFSYTVAPGDTDTNGVDIVANSINLNDATLTDSLENRYASLSFSTVRGGNTQVVDGRGPTINSITIGAHPESDFPLSIGEKLRVTVDFSEDVTVTGSMYIGVLVAVGASNRTAAYAATDETDASILYFDYEIAAGDADSDGAHIDANNVWLGRRSKIPFTSQGQEVSIRDSVGNWADLGHPVVPPDSRKTVDGVRPGFDFDILVDCDNPVDYGCYMDSAERYTVEFTFSEPVRGFTHDDVTIHSGGTKHVDTFTAFDGGKVYTIQITPAATVVATGGLTPVLILVLNNAAIAVADGNGSPQRAYIFPVVPGPVQNVRVTAATATGFTVAWDPPAVGAGGLDDYYFVGKGLGADVTPATTPPTSYTVMTSNDPLFSIYSREGAYDKRGRGVFGTVKPPQAEIVRVELDSNVITVKYKYHTAGTNVVETFDLGYKPLIQRVQLQRCEFRCHLPGSWTDAGTAQDLAASGATPGAITDAGTGAPSSHETVKYRVRFENDWTRGNGDWSEPVTFTVPDIATPVITVNNPLQVTSAPSRVFSAYDKKLEATTWHYLAQTTDQCADDVPTTANGYNEGADLSFTSASDNDKYVCFWATYSSNNSVAKAVSAQITGISASATMYLTVTNPDQTIPARSRSFTVAHTGGAADTLRYRVQSDASCNVANYADALSLHPDNPVTVQDENRNGDYVCFWIKESASATAATASAISHRIRGIDRTGPMLSVAGAPGPGRNYQVRAELSDPTPDGMTDADNPLTMWYTVETVAVGAACGGLPLDPTGADLRSIPPAGAADYTPGEAVIFNMASSEKVCFWYQDRAGNKGYDAGHAVGSFDLAAPQIEVFFIALNWDDGTATRTTAQSQTRNRLVAVSGSDNNPMRAWFRIQTSSTCSPQPDPSDADTHEWEVSQSFNDDSGRYEITFPNSLTLAVGESNVYVCVWARDTVGQTDAEHLWAVARSPRVSNVVGPPIITVTNPTQTGLVASRSFSARDNFSGNSIWSWTLVSKRPDCDTDAPDLKPYDEGETVVVNEEASNGKYVCFIARDDTYDSESDYTGGFLGTFSAESRRHVSVTSYQIIGIDHTPPVITVRNASGSLERLPPAKSLTYLAEVYDEPDTDLPNPVRFVYRIMTPSNPADEPSCPDNPPGGTTSYADNRNIIINDQRNNNKWICFWATDGAGNVGKAHTEKLVNMDTTPPSLSSADVPPDNRSVVILTYNENLRRDRNRHVESGYFTVDVNGSPRRITSVTVNGARITLTLALPTTTTDMVRVSYNPIRRTEGRVADVALNYAPDFSNRAVTQNAANNAPSVEAGAAVTMTEATTRTIGRSSDGLVVTDTDTNNDALTYTWEQTSPDPSDAANPRLTISHTDPTSPQATITAPNLLTDTDFTLTLTVDDGTVRDMPASDTLVVSVTADNDAPTAAIAGGNRSVGQNSEVTLDGSGSSDPEGQTLTYAWTKTSGPTVTLDDTNPAKPTFTAPLVTTATDLVFTLTVSDGTTRTPPATTATATATITVQPTASVSSVSFPTRERPYNAQDEITATVTFTLPVTVIGTPALPLWVGANKRDMVYQAPASSPSNTLTFTYDVQPGDTDTNGVSIDANAFSLGRATIMDAHGRAPTAITHDEADGDADHRVDTTRPTLSITFQSYDFATSTLSATTAQRQTRNRLVKATATDASATQMWYKAQATSSCGTLNIGDTDTHSYSVSYARGAFTAAGPVVVSDTAIRYVCFWARDAAQNVASEYSAYIYNVVGPPGITVTLRGNQNNPARFRTFQPNDDFGGNAIRHWRLVGSTDSCDASAFPAGDPTVYHSYTRNEGNRGIDTPPDEATNGQYFCVRVQDDSYPNRVATFKAGDTAIANIFVSPITVNVSGPLLADGSSDTAAEALERRYKAVAATADVARAINWRWKIVEPAIVDTTADFPCGENYPEGTTSYLPGDLVTVTRSADSNKYVCFWTEDRIGNKGNAAIEITRIQPPAITIVPTFADPTDDDPDIGKFGLIRAEDNVSGIGTTTWRYQVLATADLTGLTRHPFRVLVLESGQTADEAATQACAAPVPRSGTGPYTEQGNIVVKEEGLNGHYVCFWTTGRDGDVGARAEAIPDDGVELDRVITVTGNNRRSQSRISATDNQEPASDTTWKVQVYADDPDTEDDERPEECETSAPTSASDYTEGAAGYDDGVTATTNDDTNLYFQRSDRGKVVCFWAAGPGFADPVSERVEVRVRARERPSDPDPETEREQEPAPGTPDDQAPGPGGDGAAPPHPEAPTDGYPITDAQRLALEIMLETLLGRDFTVTATVVALTEGDDANTRQFPVSVVGLLASDNLSGLGGFTLGNVTVSAPDDDGQRTATIGLSDTLWVQAEAELAAHYGTLTIRLRKFTLVWQPTAPNAATLPGGSDQVTQVGAQFETELTAPLPDDASLTVRFSKDPSDFVHNASALFSAVARRVTDNGVIADPTEDVAFSVQVASDLDNRVLGNTTVRMQVSRAWYEAQTDEGKVVTVVKVNDRGNTHLPDRMSVRLVPGIDIYEITAVFTGAAGGFSSFTMLAVQREASAQVTPAPSPTPTATPTPSPTPDPALTGGVGGSFGVSVGPTPTPTPEPTATPAPTATATPATIPTPRAIRVVVSAAPTPTPAPPPTATIEPAPPPTAAVPATAEAPSPTVSAAPGAGTNREDIGGVNLRLILIIALVVDGVLIVLLVVYLIYRLR